MKPPDPLSEKDECNSKGTKFSRSADHSTYLPRLSALGEEVEMSRNHGLEELSQKGVCESAVESYLVNGRECLPQGCSEETVIKMKHENMANEKIFLTMVISVLFSIKEPITVSFLSTLIGEWENMTISLRFISKNSSLFVIYPLDKDLIIQLKDSP